MPASVWTIKAGATEKSAADWGLNAEPMLDLPLLAPKKFTWFMAGSDPATEPSIPFGTRVVIKQNGGSNFQFQGRQMSEEGRAIPGRQGIALEFLDEWSFLENLIFQHFWNLYYGSPGNLVQAAQSRIYLFQAFPTAGNLTVAQQISAIIQYAISCGANLQLGAELPQPGAQMASGYAFPANAVGAYQMPYMPAKALTCAAAIIKCLEQWPDLVPWIDDSTAVPTFHLWQKPSPGPLGNLNPAAPLTPVTLPFKAMFDINGAAVTNPSLASRIHKSSRITPLYKLIPSQVVLQYLLGSPDNAAQTNGYVDVWPPGSTGAAEFAIVAPIDLRAGKTSVTTLAGVLVTRYFDPTNLLFWTGDKPNSVMPAAPSLADKDIVNLALVNASINDNSQAQGIKVTDAGGNAINLGTYPNQLLPRLSVYKPWMAGVNIIEAKVTAYFSYQKKPPVGTGTVTTHDVVAHPVTARIKLCNAPIGTTNYSASGGFSIAGNETAVPNLAKNIYAAWQIPQYEGMHEIVELGIPAIIGPWNLLNLTGGKVLWQTMNATISHVRIDFGKTPGTDGAGEFRTTQISIGPAKHLSPVDLNSLMQTYRNRLFIDDPGIRIGGGVGGPLVDTSEQAPADDNAPGEPQLQADVIVGTTPI